MRGVALLAMLLAFGRPMGDARASCAICQREAVQGGKKMTRKRQIILSLLTILAVQGIAVAVYAREEMARDHADVGKEIPNAPVVAIERREGWRTRAHLRLTDLKADPSK